MSMSVAAEDFLPDMSRGTVVVESDFGPGEFQKAFEELNAIDARSMAQTHAAKNGMSNPFINGNVIGPYPVNAEGLPLDEVRDEKGKSLPQTHARMQPNRYRIEIPLARPLR